jgi:hypothetical protein
MHFLKPLLLLYFISTAALGFTQTALNSKHTQRYYVLFSARAPALRPFSIGGHAFITWRKEDTVHHKSSQFTYGFAPKKGKGMGVFKSVKGQMEAGYIKNSNKELFIRRFIIEIDSAQFTNSLKEIPVWKKESYSLLNKNCVTFMNEIALIVGLKETPTKFCIFPIRPYKYIKKLKKKNAERITKNAFLEHVRLRILKKAHVREEKED